MSYIRTDNIYRILNGRLKRFNILNGVLTSNVMTLKIEQLKPDMLSLFKTNIYA